MIEIRRKQDCCGCGACKQCCPSRCITMKEDDEGFLYPVTDRERCAGCGLCERVCPVINRRAAASAIKTFAAKNKDIGKRELSSSGGLFIALAERCIGDGGTVFGVVFDDNWEARHIGADSIDGVLPMMRSKYMQSRTEDTFSEARTLLRQGRKVLFTGTPCQIAGLKSFLRRDYDNLIAVSLICHGTPSPMVWRRYLVETADNGSLDDDKRGLNAASDQTSEYARRVSDISFREKSRSGFEWERYGIRIWMKGAADERKNGVGLSSVFTENPFMRCFLSNLCLRPSCYDCPAKGGASQADLTIADFWGIRDVMPAYHDSHGVGLAVAHSEKGLQELLRCNVDLRKTDIGKATAHNPSYWHSVAVPPQRERFFSLISGGESVKKATRQCLHTPLLARLRKNPAAEAKRLIRKCLPNRVVLIAKRIVNMAIH